MVTVEVLPEYGYVLLVAIASIFLFFWQGMKVGGMRKKCNINYPNMYSKDNDLFNCYQRAHQNTLENYPQFLILLLIGGLQYPLVNTAAGIIWIAGKVSYSLGYYSGEPSKRLRGTYSYIGLLIMLFTSISFALHLTGCL